MMISEQQEARHLQISGQNKPHIGFLGMGWIGKNRFASVHESGCGGRLSICDPFAEDLAGYCESISITPVSAYEHLLEKETDGIVIATPSAMHHHQVSQALEKGKAVFCQKPLACTATATEDILQLARQKNCLLMIDFSYRYTHAVQTIKQLLEEGELGEVFAANFIFHNAYGPDKSWYYNRELSGGGCVMDLGIHLIDLAQWLIPAAEVQHVHGSLYTKGKRITDPKKQIEDYASVHMVHANGITTHLACSWNLSAGKDAVIEMDVFGTKASASFRNINGSFYDFTAVWNRGTHTQTMSAPPDNWGGKAILDWTERLAQGNRYQKDANSYARTARIIDRIYDQQ